MVAMPIHDTVRPSSLQGQTNGSVDESLLQVVDDKAGYQWMMTALPARGMRAMHAAVYARFGVRLSSVGRGRSFGVQLSTFVQRHTPVSKTTFDATAKIVGVANKRIWPNAGDFGYDSIYWILKKGFASAAVPGTSPHGWWCADDVCLPGNVGISARPDILEWMYLNEHLYGFAHSLLSEPWHVQWIMGDTIPLAVMVYEKSLEQKPDPVTPEVPVIKPPTPTLDSDLMIVRYHLVDAHAQFLGIGVKLADGRIVALWLEWTGSGDDEKVKRRLKNFEGIAVDITGVSVADLSSCTLFGPLPVDGLYQWTGDEFARVIS